MNEVFWRAIERERRALAADLRKLSPNDWDRPSLSQNWRVRDVVAHLILESHYNNVRSILGFASSGFQVNQFLDRAARKLGDKDPAYLITQLADESQNRTAPWFISPHYVLVDLLIHRLDIMIPLGLDSTLSPDSTRLVFTGWQPSRWHYGDQVVGLPRRIQGLSFRVPDIGWQWGQGPEVTGSPEAILLALSGRSALFDQLTGEGVAVLRQRL